MSVFALLDGLGRATRVPIFLDSWAPLLLSDGKMHKAGRLGEVVRWCFAHNTDDQLAAGGAPLVGAVQVGCRHDGRGVVQLSGCCVPSRWPVGWYSWDWLDNGGRPSATEVHPEWQWE
jgi:hypothetical protein